MGLFVCLTCSMFTYWFAGGTGTDLGTLVPMVLVTQVMAKSPVGFIW
jgi:hypothetical protein